MNRTEVFERCFNAAQHYRDTGKHKQVSFRYNPEERTQFEFSSWKHERDHDSVRKILVEDIDYYYSNTIARASKTMSECRSIKTDLKKTGTEG